MELEINAVDGPWIGNDYGGKGRKQANVVMSKATIGGKLLALMFMTNMNIDFDGDPEAYGPPDWQAKGLKKEPRDVLQAAGKDTGYYGLVSVHPITRTSNTGWAVPSKIEYDKDQPDALGRCPVVQQKGKDPAPGYYVSSSAVSTGKGTAFDQNHYVNSAAVAFHALSYRLGLAGVGGDDFGLALRHYFIMAGEGHKKGSGAHEWSVGECSYRVFLDIGGQPKPKGAYANNNFPTSFVIFPGSAKSALPWISLASNSTDFAVFLALLAEADRAQRGSSPIPAYRKYVSGGRTAVPANTQRIISALVPYGYAPALSLVGALL
jgi:hypothetical protein